MEREGKGGRRGGGERVDEILNNDNHQRVCVYISLFFYFLSHSSLPHSLSPFAFRCENQSLI